MTQSSKILFKYKYWKSILPYAVPGCIIFIYIFIRATSVGITYDEAWTINDFVHRNFWELLLYTRCNANHHLLNTLLIKLLYTTGIHSVFLARLPNLIAGLLYLVFSYKIAQKLFSSYFGFVLFILLITNPFLLDFFSLARGYGLSLGFQMMALYYFILFSKMGTVRDGLSSLICATLSVLSSFTAFNFWIPLFIVTLFRAMITMSIEKQRILFIGFLFISIILFVLTAIPIYKLAESNGFGYGGDQNFYIDTLLSLTKYLFYSPNVSKNMLYGLPFFCLLFVSGFIYIFFRQRNGANWTSPLRGLLILLVLAILTPMIQHWILGTRFPIDRGALGYYPLIILGVVVICSELPRSWGQITAFLLLTGCISNFFMRANTSKTAIWYFDAHTPALLGYFNEMGEKSNQIIALDFSWPFQSAIAYYLTINNYPFIKIVKDYKHREEINLSADYYLYLNSSLEKVGYNANNQKILLLKIDTIIQYKDEGVVVLRILKPQAISD